MSDDGEIAQATRWLQRLTGDPMAGAVAGRVRVLEVNEPAARGRFQECVMRLAVEPVAGTDAQPATVDYRAVFPRKAWPAAGDVAPARVSVSTPGAFDADWNALRRP